MTPELLGGFLLSILGNILAAFAGGGGSLILMSGLIMLFPSMSYLAVLTLTKTSAAVLTLSSGLMHSRKNTVDWKMIAGLILGGVLGIALATYLVQYKIEDGVLIKFIPVLLFSLVIYLGLKKELGVGEGRKKAFKIQEYLEAASFSFFISLANGMISGLGPVFVAFFIIRFKTSFIQTIAYMMISGMVINILQASYLLSNVEVSLPLIGFIVIGALIGSFFGTKLQYFAGNKLVKPIALASMTAMGLSIVFS